jgi:hypothetical protein
LKKIGVLALLLVLAFGASGIGYAHWAQTLYVDVTAETGILCWGFEEGTLEAIKDTDVPPPNQDPANWDWGCEVGFYGPPWQTDKNVGYVEVELLDDKGCDHKGYKLFETAKITLHNVYPCYFNDFHVWVANGGTIPIIVETIRITDPSGTTELSNGEHYWNQFMEIIWGDALGEQIDPCQSREVSFKFHVLEEGDVPETGADPVAGAQPGQTYEFTIELVGVQWNLVD